jgi:hypothetical protein
MTVTPVPEDMKDRPCPYCHAPLGNAASAMECDACGALHHVECWNDAGGCATYGCANSPTTVGQTQAAESRGFLSSPLGIGGIATVVILVLAGSAFAIVTVLSGNSPVAGTSDSGTDSTVSSASSTTTDTATEPGLDTLNGKSFIHSYYDLINARRFADAWQGLSSSARTVAGGYANWKAGYAHTDTTTLTGVQTTDSEGDVVTMSVSITSLATCSDQSYEQEFSGDWTVDLAAAQIDSSSFEQVGGDYLPEDC